MGIRDKPIAPRSPWQNGFAEGLIGSIRRECLDHMVVYGEDHLRKVLREDARYYNEVRTRAPEGCAGAPRHSTGGHDQLPSNAGRTSPSVCPESEFSV